MSDSDIASIWSDRLREDRAILEAQLSPAQDAAVRRILEKLLAGGQLAFLVVYGSVSRGEQRPGSDLDIYYETRDEAVALEEADPESRWHVFGAASGALLESLRLGDEMAFSIVTDALVVYDDGSFQALVSAADEEGLEPTTPEPGGVDSGGSAERTDPTVLSTGAELRSTGSGAAVVVCVNGGQAGEVEGTWSASLEWLVQRLAPRLPNLRFVEVRYRVKSWRQLDRCIDDARAAISEAGGARTILLGFSMGAAVAIGAAEEPSVERVLGLAPWIPDRLALEPLRGRRLDILHGSLDRRLPGIPGVSPASSRRAFERAQALGVEGTYELIRGALHGIAVRAHWGPALPLPRARAWSRRVEALLATF